MVGRARTPDDTQAAGTPMSSPTPMRDRMVETSAVAQTICDETRTHLERAWNVPEGETERLQRILDTPTTDGRRNG